MTRLTITATLAAFVLTGPTAGVAWGDSFTLTGSQHKDVTTTYSTGTLYDTSTANISTGAWLRWLYSYDASSVSVDGGTVVQLIGADSSSVCVTGGGIGELGMGGTGSVLVSGGAVGAFLWAYGNSTASVTGGAVSNVWASGSSHVVVSGGEIRDEVISMETADVTVTGVTIGVFSAYHSSALTVVGSDFEGSDGVSLSQFDTIDGVPQYRVVGTGTLSGKWLDGTPWTSTVFQNDATATFLLVPEPASLAILAVGGLAVERRRRS